MSRDELAARLFVGLMSALQANHLENERHNSTASAGAKVFSDEPIFLAQPVARESFEMADAFEAERKRRLTEPEQVNMEEA